ncbi:MAG: PEP-CTERM sorting domain-containing protein [Planctomycetota bacterium]|nr:MAG: PEP-CTERM sorting domain-containing protein [Planctomycetota bacterium]
MAIAPRPRTLARSNPAQARSCGNSISALRSLPATCEQIVSEPTEPLGQARGDRRETVGPTPFGGAHAGNSNAAPGCAGAVAAVPEPAGMGVVAAGLAAAWVLRRRRVSP